MKPNKSEVKNRDEIIYILDYLLTKAKLNSFSNTHTIPNGNQWHYEEVREYVMKNLK